MCMHYETSTVRDTARCPAPTPDSVNKAYLQPGCSLSLYVIENRTVNKHRNKRVVSQIPIANVTLTPVTAMSRPALAAVSDLASRTRHASTAHGPQAASRLVRPRGPACASEVHRSGWPLPCDTVLPTHQVERAGFELEVGHSYWGRSGVCATNCSW